jgi:hypothetical protein
MEIPNYIIFNSKDNTLTISYPLQGNITKEDNQMNLLQLYNDWLLKIENINHIDIKCTDDNESYIHKIILIIDRIDSGTYSGTVNNGTLHLTFKDTFPTHIVHQYP